MRTACWIPKATHTHTHRICFAYCFSTATMVARMRLNVTLYLFCPSWWIFNLLVHQITSKLLKGSTLRDDTAFQTFWHRSFTVYIISTEATQSRVFWMKGTFLTVTGWCLGGSAPEKFVQWMFHCLDDCLHEHSWPLATECPSYQHVTSRSHEE